MNHFAGHHGWKRPSGPAQCARALAFGGLLAWLGLGTASFAIPITPAAFNGTQLVESFEGLAAGSNVGAGPFAGLLEPGTTGSFTFASGVTLTNPIPNPGTMSNGVFVHDFAVATGTTNNWGTNGTVSSAVNVPFGSAYIGAFDNLTSATNPVSMTFTFSGDQGPVGAYVTGAGGKTVTLSAYDALGNFLESATVPTVPVASWGSNFLGLSRTEGIRSVIFSGVDFGLDGLTFQALPEPDAFVLGIVGILMLAAWHPRRSDP